MNQKRERPTKTSRAIYIKIVAAVLFMVSLAALWYGISGYRATRITTTALMDKITNKVQSTYTNVSVNKTTWPAQMGSQLALHADGYGFSISSQSMPSMYLGLTDVASPGNGDAKKTAARLPSDAHATIMKTMKRAGFKIDASNNQLPLVVYTRHADNCFEIYDTKQGILTFSCYQKDDITTASRLAQPFVTAYNQAHSSQAGTPADLIGPAVIKSQNGLGVIGGSKDTDYDIAEAVITIRNTKHLALFYNKGGSQWIFVSQADDEYGFKCQDFMANAEVRAAMKGQICLADNGQIRLDEPNASL